MSNFFQKATRSRVFLKLGITGPSGSGKTYSALRLAFGMVPNPKIAVLDTENRSAELYADLKGKDGIGEFFHCPLAAPFTPERYIEIIEAAAAEGVDVLIIDSMTHEWSGNGGILDIKTALDTRTANTWGNWAQLTPRHNRFKEAILQTPLHVICTIRSKQDWVVDAAGNKPKKVGLAPEQRDGTEYEFTTVFDLAMDHNAMPSKDRTGLFPTFNERLTPATGKVLRDWLDSGGEPADAASDPATINASYTVREEPVRPAPESRGDASVAVRPAAITDGAPASRIAGFVTTANEAKKGREYRAELAQLCGRKTLGDLNSLPAEVAYEGRSMPLVDAAARLLATVTGDVFAGE